MLFCTSDEDWTPFEDDLFFDEDQSAEPSSDDVAELIQPMSSSDSNGNAKSKGITENQKPHRNQTKKGDGRDAEKDDWDLYDYSTGFFDREGEQRLEQANRWAKRRVGNAYAWLDRHKEKISKLEFPYCWRDAKFRLKH
jgi:hypothetical protein